MVTPEDIKHLGDLSRVEVTDEEAKSIAEKIDSILLYVGQIKNAVSEGGLGDQSELPLLHNVMRDDVVTHEPRQYTEAVLSNAPARQGDYVKVKKIL